MLLNEILEYNKEFAEEFEGIKISHIPQKKLVIVTCMDTRLTDGFLEKAMGISRGDAKIIKNAGNNVLGRDVIRSVAAAIFALGAEEIMVVGHYDCGMSNVNGEKLKSNMLERDIPSEEIAKVNIEDWIGSIESEESNVIDGVNKIRNSPLIPKDVPIHGIIMDPINGKVDLLINGY
ncbi:Beta-carbonic anhydrase 1 [bioreactor metagenome]|uniref:Beta-carbonic anhydrase 1 n=1 Tax=bioreactor metagenome TaxID=1076179 RepID=A0A644T746_9ZZZZ|nr:carbonic anhydrase [Methanobrevibacter sp.]MEA4957807.1 carbonic anhydrase [Methanobrevibacter sp.]